MHLNRNTLILLTLILLLIALLLFIKFYTAEAYHGDDPSVALIIKTSPSFKNRFQLNHHQKFSDFTVLIIDENEFIGQRIYQSLTDWLWIVLLLILAAAGITQIIHRNRK